jgi:subtilisin family serine protease
MKKVTLLIYVLAQIYIAKAQSEDFYYYFDTKVYLQKVDNEYTICFEANDSHTTEELLELNNFNIVKKLGENLFFLNLTEGQKTELVNLLPIKSIHPRYLTNQNRNFIYATEIALKIKLGIDNSQVTSLYDDYNLTQTKSTSLYDIVECSNEFDALQLSNILFETGLFEYVHPKFSGTLLKSGTIPTDPYFHRQYYLHNTGQTLNHGHTGMVDADIDAPEAWDITKGSPNIVIAVIDDGVVSNHPDLPNSRQIRLNAANIGARTDFTDSNDVSPIGNDNHGSACAGIIAASHNNEGVAGVAPNCKIMPIRIDFQLNGSSDTDIADAIKFATDNGADILLCSWSHQTSANIKTALEDASIRGRNGKGIVIAFAAGNNERPYYPVHFPAFAAVDGLICVGASDRYDNQAYYSPEGGPLDVVAPSHKRYNGQGLSWDESVDIWTIDIPGSYGYNPVDEYPDSINPVGKKIPSSGTNFLAYTGRMGGTSAAAPQVAGVAALLLSMNPCLTSSEVEEIIEENADKVGSLGVLDYGHNSNRPGHSIRMGYGRLNAFRSLTPKKYIQNETFSSTQNTIKAYGIIKVGQNVTSSIPNGNVIVTATGELRLIAGTSIEIYDGFETSNSADFIAEIVSNTNSCYGWNAATFPTPMKKESWIPDYNNNLDSVANNLNTIDDFVVTVFPNPASSKVFINLQLKEQMDYKVSITDIQGKTLLHVKKQGRKGANNTGIDISSLSSGAYFIQVKGKNYKKTDKLIIVR